MPMLTQVDRDLPLCTPTVLPTIATDDSDLELIVAQVLQRHPSFAIFTVDGKHWIDPYTGARIPVSSGSRQAARAYLMKRRPWVRDSLHASEELELFRWRLYLGEHLASERRLRVFAHDGRWQNPFSGALTTVTAPSGMTDAVLQQMAAVLAACPHARRGQLMDRLRLEAALASQRLVTPLPLDPPTRITTRITGPRSTGSLDRTATASGLDREQVRIKTSLDSVLSPLPTIPGYGMALHFEPMSGVGGDFYDCTRLDHDRWFIALGDVSGHGVEGARVAVAAVRALRTILRDQRDLVAIVSRLNDGLHRELPRGHFVTLFAAILDSRSNRLTCVCAGHHPGLLVSRTRSCILERIGNRGPALGLRDASDFSAQLRPATTTLAGGDTLFLYTDGLTEAKNDQQTEYGLNRVMGSLVANLESPYDQLVGEVVSDTKRFAAGVIDDDLTVLALSLGQQA